MTKIAIGIIVVLVAVSVLASYMFPSFLKKLEFELAYRMYSYSGTREKMDAFDRESVANAGRNGKPVLIIVHGADTEYYRDPFGAAIWFREQGINVVSFDYDYRAAPDSSAQKLSDYVDQVMRETKTDKVDLWGVCLGGMLARYYSEHFDGAKHIGRLITTAAPANYRVHPGGIAYQFNQRFLFNVDPWNEAMKYVTDKNSVRDHIYIYCKEDWIIPVSDQVSAQGNFFGLDCGHTYNDVNPDILGTVLGFLKK